MKRRTWLGGAVLGSGGLLGGCITFDVAGPDQAQLQYRWRDLGTAPARREAPLVPALLLQAVPGEPAADTLGISYERTPGAFAAYQYAHWAERPLRVLPRVLQQRLETRGTAGVTAMLGDPQRADWLLALSIVEIHHAASASPGQARLAITAELYDRSRRQRAARRRFDAGAPVAAADAAAAVDALSQALTTVLDALLPWLEEALAAALARR